MRIGSGLFLSGILTLLQFHELPSLLTLLLFPLLAALAVRYTLLRPVLWYVSGFFWLLVVSEHILDKGLEADLEGQEITICGQVVSLPSVSAMSTQFDFEVTSVIDQYGQHRPVPGKIRLNWYRPYPNILPGEVYELVVKLKRSRGYINPGGFDYEAWLFQQRIRATGYVRANSTLPENYHRHFTFDSVRYFLREKLDRVLAASVINQLVPALIIGDRSNMENRHWRVLAATGTSHLLAISGLHIGLVAGFVYAIFRWLWPLWPIASALVPAPRLASAMSLLAAGVYALLAGFTIPTRRALIMIGVVILAGFFGRRTAPGHLFGLAVLAVLVLDPLAVLSGGFWLSFTAVLLILLSLHTDSGVSDRNSVFKRLRQWGRVQICIYAGLMPLLIIWFNQLPLLSLIANSIAIPWVSLVCLPLILLAVPVLLIHEQAGTVILDIGTGALGILWRFLEYLASIDGALIALPAFSWFALAAAVTGIALLFMPAGVPGKWLGIICLLPLLFPWKDLPAKGEFDMTVLEVGQGLAVVIQTQEHLLLYDTGPGFSSGFNAGWAIIVPYLKYSGHQQIHTLVLSHGDNDHIGGLKDVQAMMRVDQILTSVPDKIVSGPMTPCMAGQRWEWDNIQFEILSPEINDNNRGNDASCVLKVNNSTHSVLLSGDIERPAEMKLLEKNTDVLAADVLLAPHHGSNTSSSPAFIRAVAPDHVIFSTGYLNRFGFPGQEVLNRYRDHDVDMLNTAHDGAISIQFRHRQISIVKARQKSLRYWNN